VRDHWLNLNGLWQFREDPADVGLRDKWWQSCLPGESRQIQVPYPVEAEASGIHNTDPASVIWYETEFQTPEAWQGRIVLRFGAVDQWTRVFINGHEVGQHRGGYAPFAFDIDHALQQGINRLTVRVEDSLSWTQPRGKQAGTTRWPIDYDSVTGIWQTVWLEPLAPVSIESVYSTFTRADSCMTLQAAFSTHVRGRLTVELSQQGKVISTSEVEIDLRAEARCRLQVENPDLWCPENPALYDLKLTLDDSDRGESDTVLSYAGLREISTGGGVLRLNGEPLYLKGILDQGYFPGGWYTPMSDDDLRRDVELTLAMGFNCVRKHQKAEDPRYLYWADRLGLMVWSEMPSGRIFSTELVDTLTREWIDLLVRDRGHPSVIAWVPFNESWGVWHQADRGEQRAFVEGIVGLTKSLDASRPVIGNDGWEYSAGDLWTLHVYNPAEDLSTQLTRLKNDPGSAVAGEGTDGRTRIGALVDTSVKGLPILLTECGGIGFGHYSDEDFSYGELPRTTEQLEANIRSVIAEIQEVSFLQGFFWTQLTDIQQEINGLLSFDRTPKLPLAILHEIFSATPGGNE
jgi:beta-galactosidase/beta-glucuronidase